MLPGPIVVTGAGGFIGSHLCQRLAHTGCEVRALDVRPMPPHLAVPGLTYTRADLRNSALLASVLDGARTIYHLASLHLQVNAADEAFEDVNVRGTAMLVEAASAAGVGRFVHTSSVGVYGNVQRPPADEESLKQPVTAYERSKLLGERVAREEAARRGLDLIVLRPTWVYGPGCPRTLKLTRALRRGRFFYVGSGRNLRHPLYVDDIVEAFLLAGSAGELEHRDFIIAGPRAMTLRELVDTWARVLQVVPPRLSVPRPVAYALGAAAESAFGLAGREPPFSRRSLLFFEHDNAFDGSRARRELGFQAGIDLEEGVRRVLEAERAGEAGWEIDDGAHTGREVSSAKPRGAVTGGLP